MANLKREESVCLPKKEFSWVVFLRKRTSLSVSSILVGLTSFLNGKCKRSHLSIRPRWCFTHRFPAPPANGLCEQLEVDFPSVLDHSISISGQRALTVKLVVQDSVFPSSLAMTFMTYYSSLMVCSRFHMTPKPNDSKLTVLSVLINVSVFMNQTLVPPKIWCFGCFVG